MLCISGAIGGFDGPAKLRAARVGSAAARITLVRFNYPVPSEFANAYHLRRAARNFIAPS